jgi:hypothetical protein
MYKLYHVMDKIPIVTVFILGFSIFSSLTLDNLIDLEGKIFTIVNFYFS